MSSHKEKSSHHAKDRDQARIRGIIVERPIVYGSIAFPLGKKAEEGVRTHKWICYVRLVITYFAVGLVSTNSPAVL